VRSKQHAPEHPVGQRGNLKKDIKKYLETNEKGNTIYQNFWGCSKRSSTKF